ncbi:MAG: hypothetical protein FWD00_01705 [Clostridiales bacterium]|nr:hypothetical protein [Clostridiales bacterium]
MDISKGSRLIENIKSALLVVLFLLTILLLYLFWGDTPLRGLMGEEQPRYAAIDPIEIFQPDRIEISFGGGDYTVAGTHHFAAIMEGFSAFSEGGNLLVEEITQERYELEVLMRPSIKAVFEYYLPFSALRELYGIDRIHGADAIDAVSELVYVADFDHLLFVYDRNSDKHFRIVGRSNNDFEPVRQIIQDAQRNHVPYHTLENFMGGTIHNRTLIPVSFESNLYDIPFSREDFSRHPDRVTDIVRSFFSDHFDFVRQIADENGTVIYMYGFGRIVVVAHNNGILEFRRELDDRSAAPLTYLEAFERANSFIAMHGGFSAIGGGMPLTPYIREVVVDPDGNRGFRFVFGIQIAGSRVYDQGGHPMVVDVIGDRVTYFQRQLIHVNSNDIRQADQGYRQVFLPVINMIAANTEPIQAALPETQEADAEELSFEAILEKVTRLDVGYVKRDGHEDTLSAAWIVTIDGLEFYFGLDDGALLGHGLQ